MAGPNQINQVSTFFFTYCKNLSAGLKKVKGLQGLDMSIKNQAAERNETQWTLFSVGDFKESFFALLSHKVYFIMEAFQNPFVL